MVDLKARRSSDLFGYTRDLLLHMLGGIRHLPWGTGRGSGPMSEDGWRWRGSEVLAQFATRIRRALALRQPHHLAQSAKVPKPKQPQTTAGSRTLLGAGRHSAPNPSGRNWQTVPAKSERFLHARA